MKSEDLTPETVLIDALLDTHAAPASDDKALVRAIFERTTQVEGHDDPALHSLIDVYQERAGGIDHELIAGIQSVTTRRSADTAPVVPFPQRASGFLKVAAIVIVFCGGVFGLVSTIPVKQPTLSISSSSKDPIEPRMHVTIVHSKPATPHPIVVSTKAANRSDQWSTPLVASAATDFVSSIDFALSDPAVQFGIPDPSGLSTEIISDRPVRHSPAEPPPEPLSPERYASAPEDRAIAIVNRSVISERDLDQFQSTQTTPMPEQAAIEALIDDRLLLSEFERRGGRVADAFVDQTLSNFVEQAFAGDHSAFERSIDTAGLTLAGFRELLERQIAVQGLLTAEPTLASNLRDRAEILRAK